VSEWCRQQYIKTGKCGLVRQTASHSREATDERALSQIRTDHPLIEKILAYRELQKMRSTFVLPLLGMDRLHPNWLLTRVKSGRVATKDPNIMAFPAPGRSAWGTRLRECFVADPGWVFVGLDYSQLEMRIAAHLTEDPKLIDIYRTGRDLYVETARELFRTETPEKPRYRTPAKVTTLGTLYGIQAYKLWEQLILFGCVDESGQPWYTIEQCDGLLAGWMGVYSEVPKYIARVVSEARQNNAMVYTALSGRPRYLPALWLEGERYPNSKLRAEAERQAFNHQDQGTAADVVKRAQVRLWAEQCDEWEPHLQYHDELVLSVRKGREDYWAGRFKTLMEEDSGLFRVPLTVEAKMGETWAGLK
jgi:DNA polymerase-1